MFPRVAASFFCFMRFPFKATSSPRHYDDQNKKRLLEPSLEQRMLICDPSPWLQLAFCWPVWIFNIFVISERSVYVVILKELMSPVTAACSAFAGCPSSPHWSCAYSCFGTISLLPCKSGLRSSRRGWLSQTAHVFPCCGVNGRSLFEMEQPLAWRWEALHGTAPGPGSGTPSALFVPKPVPLGWGLRLPCLLLDLAPRDVLTGSFAQAPGSASRREDLVRVLRGRFSVFPGVCMGLVLTVLPSQRSPARPRCVDVRLRPGSCWQAGQAIRPTAL